MIVRLLALAVVVWGTGCASNGTGVPVDEAFEIAQGRTIHVAGTDASIKFETVTADSRCPSDVQCVWAGDAEVVLRVRTAGLDTSLVLHTGPDPRAARIGTLRVELVGLTPVPRSTVTTPGASYRATLIIGVAN